MTPYKIVMELMSYIMLIIGAAIAVSAIGAYNHGNDSYAIYAVGSATFCGTASITFAIMRASNR